MSEKSSIGMRIVSILSILLGGMMAIGNTIEVVRGETFDGMAVDTPLKAVLGLIGAVFAAILAVGGLGTWAVKPYGRKLSLIAGGAMLILNGLAVILFRFPFTYFLMGAIYPAVLFISYNLSGWRTAFGAK